MRLQAVLLLCCLSIPLILLAWKSYELDFRAFYVASESVSHHLDPYRNQSARGEQFDDGSALPAMSRWIYPPSALFFAMPLAGFPYITARLSFDIISLASLVWILVDLSTRFAVPTVWAALALVSIPVAACMQRGQSDILVLLCLVLTYRWLPRWRAGIPLGIAISIKIFPVALLLWLILEKKFRAAAAGISFAMVLGVIAGWRFGFSSYLSFIGNLTALHSASVRAGRFDLMHMFSISNVSGPWLSISPGFVGSYNNPLIVFDTGGIIVGCLLVAVSARFLASRRIAPEAGFFAMVLFSQLMNTTLWSMGMVMYIPLCLILIVRLRSTIFSILLMLPLYLPSQIRVLGVSPRFVIALALAAYVIATRKELKDFLSIHAKEREISTTPRSPQPHHAAAIKSGAPRGL